MTEMKSVVAKYVINDVARMESIDIVGLKG
jgi:hypothetical protein